MKVSDILRVKGGTLYTVTPETPLHEACDGKRPENARLLLERGADPNALDGNKRTPLIAQIAAWRMAQKMKGGLDDNDRD